MFNLLYALHENDVAVLFHAYGIESHHFAHRLGDCGIMQLHSHREIFEFVVYEVDAVLVSGFREVFQHLRH